MYCSNCGAENADAASFCNKCGKPINDGISLGKKKRNKFLWIGGSILALIIFCCIAPLGYGYVKVKSIPTATPWPTITPYPSVTPEPTMDSVIITYAKSQADIMGREAIVMGEIGDIMGNSSPPDYENQVWKDNLYSRFDELVNLSYEAAIMPCPPGWEDVQQQLQHVHQEFVLAKADIVESLENINENSVQKLNSSTAHVQTASLYMQEATYLITHK